ncbi:hypothetical protein GJ496_005737 [Pomphorhynchus laevis]|nr:hypothetical protein GJ496_005737 [Pomphorhynchus laevis]
MQFLQFCQNQRIIPKSLKIKKQLSVNLAHLSPVESQRIKNEWNRTLNDCSRHLVKILLKFYGTTFYRSDQKIDETYYDTLVRTKIRKLRRLNARITVDEFRDIGYKPTRRFHRQRHDTVLYNNDVNRYNVARSKGNVSFEKQLSVNLAHLSPVESQRIKNEWNRTLNDCSRHLVKILLKFYGTTFYRSDQKIDETYYDTLVRTKIRKLRRLNARITVDEFRDIGYKPTRRFHRQRHDTVLYNNDFFKNTVTKEAQALEERIRDVIACFAPHEYVSRRALQDKHLALEKLMTIATNYEAMAKSPTLKYHIENKQVLAALYL